MFLDSHFIYCKCAHSLTRKHNQNIFFTKLAHISTRLFIQTYICMNYSFSDTLLFSSVLARHKGMSQEEEERKSLKEIIEPIVRL